MTHFISWVVRFLEREDGPTAAEYAIMLAVIVTVCITAITSLGGNVNKTFATASTRFASAGS